MFQKHVRLAVDVARQNPIEHQSYDVALSCVDTLGCSLGQVRAFPGVLIDVPSSLHSVHRDVG